MLADNRDNDGADDNGSLSLSVWEVYSDSVVLDWYITLQQKYRSISQASLKIKFHLGTTFFKITIFWLRVHKTLPC